jgi:DNA (cytosine-5)-methyltransferase 1
MKTYYNEYDPNAAAWLKQLCSMGLIAEGHIDERSIIDVKAEELTNYEQLHFFAGIGGWDYALQLSGWPDDKPIVTASLPCQPFSAAGKGLGQRDERHLLPQFIELVKRSNWPLIVGEQVPAAIKHGWMDDLQLEMGKQGYATGFVVLTAAGQGAPHIRKRIYWASNRISDTQHQQHKRELQHARAKPEAHGARQASEFAGRSSDNRLLADCCGQGLERRSGAECNQLKQDRQVKSMCACSDHDQSSRMQFTGVNEWHSPEWIYCRDGKQRPIKPGLKPLANGIPGRMGYSRDHCTPINANETQEARVMRIKGYGNAIVPQVAAQFLRAVMQVVGV